MTNYREATPVSAHGAVMLGGPRHGQRFVTRDPSQYLCMPQMIGWRSGPFVPDYRAELETISCEPVSIPIGHHEARAYVWPDIKRDTAKRLLADYVLSAWNKYDITHTGRKD